MATAPNRQNQSRHAGPEADSQWPYIVESATDAGAMKKFLASQIGS